MSAACRSCGAPIFWAQTEQGRRIPLDAKPVRNGNLELYVPQGKHPVVGELLTVSYREPGQGTYRAHFATCKYADLYRRR
jgi:hypothetical protein